MNLPTIELERRIFIETCKSCYTHGLFMKRSREGKPIPGICIKCNDRLRYVNKVESYLKERINKNETKDV